MVVRGPACSLDASMTTQVEVKLSWVGDFRVHGCACWNVSAFPNPLVLVGAEEPCVVSLLDHDERDAWLVVLL